MFLQQAVAAILLVTLTIALQSTGMAGLGRWAQIRMQKRVGGYSFLGAAPLLVHMATFLICMHVLEILLWAVFYRWRCIPSWESAFYFSAASYSTVGTSDVDLPVTWRTMGPIESVSGVLMCGLSASLLFAVVTRLVEPNGPPRNLPAP
jgi:hypothetical protein